MEEISVNDFVKMCEEREISENLNDYIKIYENNIPDELSERIVNTYKDTNLWNHLTIGKGEINLNIRLVEGIGISEYNIKNESEERIKIDNEIFNILSKAINEYINEFPLCFVLRDCGYQLLRYEQGYFYRLHVDKLREKEPDRILSCIISLNEDYEGGEIAFFNRKKIIKLKKGSILVFPSNFQYPHEILPIKSGTRYSIITWFN